jgi:hypothetical protein
MSRLVTSLSCSKRASRQTISTHCGCPDATRRYPARLSEERGIRSRKTTPEEEHRDRQGIRLSVGSFNGLQIVAGDPQPLTPSAIAARVPVPVTTATITGHLPVTVGRSRLPVRIAPYRRSKLATDHSWRAYAPATSR